MDAPAALGSGAAKKCERLASAVSLSFDGAGERNPVELILSCITPRAEHSFRGHDPVELASTPIQVNPCPWREDRKRRFATVFRKFHAEKLRVSENQEAYDCRRLFGHTILRIWHTVVVGN